jgi:hypothetical protein
MERSDESLTVHRGRPSPNQSAATVDASMASVPAADFRTEVITGTRRYFPRAPFFVRGIRAPERAIAIAACGLLPFCPNDRFEMSRALVRAWLASPCGLHSFVLQPWSCLLKRLGL